MRMMIFTHLVMLIMYFSVSWVVLNGLEFIVGVNHADSTIFLTAVIISFFTMFVGYKELDKEEDNE